MLELEAGDTVNIQPCRHSSPGCIYRGGQSCARYTLNSVREDEPVRLEAKKPFPESLVMRTVPNIKISRFHSVISRRRLKLS